MVMNPQLLIFFSVVDIVYPTPKPGLVKAGTDFIKDLCDGKELESSMLRW